MQKTIITLVDDIDGTEAAETVSFGLDGSLYKIDLSDVHAKELREALAPFINHSRRQGRMALTNRTRSQDTGGVSRAQAIRAWARTQPGMQNLSERGRLPIWVEQRYDAAHAA
ncbi:Lsr2 family protein [Spirillospora sp. NPDC047279]|uniref:histone-like nucleoid-structuring protein Lsr2 n=1 Tax=Spirillospora sp. NPDC047279 TaxID=3155478 RepID=UPI0034033887